MLTEGGKNSLKIMKIFGENKARTVAPPPALAMAISDIGGHDRRLAGALRDHHPRGGGRDRR
jgi:hypothetical protein